MLILSFLTTGELWQPNGSDPVNAALGQQQTCERAEGALSKQVAGQENCESHEAHAYERPALRKPFAAFPADWKVA